MPTCIAHIKDLLEPHPSRQTDVCYHDTDIINVNENVNDNEEWLNHPVCMQYLHV